MRTLALTILTVGMVLAAGQARAQTYSFSRVPTGPDSYCLQGHIWGYPGNCQFSSYAQCMATASGTDRLLRDQSPVRVRAPAARRLSGPILNGSEAISQQVAV